MPQDWRGRRQMREDKCRGPLSPLHKKVKDLLREVAGAGVGGVLGRLREKCR